MKERIIARFDKSKYTEYGEIDADIIDLIREINTYENVMTLHSCAGHPYEENDDAVSSS